MNQVLKSINLWGQKPSRDWTLVRIGISLKKQLIRVHFRSDPSVRIGVIRSRASVGVVEIERERLDREIRVQNLQSVSLKLRIVAGHRCQIIR